MRFILAFLALPLLTGCATLIDGDTQAVTVRTAPVGAACNVQGAAGRRWNIPATPATLVVHRERQDLLVTCDLAGWNRTVAAIPARFTGVTAGNLLFGGLAGVVVDEATRANYRYEQDTTILMAPPRG